MKLDIKDFIRSIMSENGETYDSLAAKLGLKTRSGAYNTISQKMSLSMANDVLGLMGYELTVSKINDDRIACSILTNRSEDSERTKRLRSKVKNSI